MKSSLIFLTGCITGIGITSMILNRNKFETINSEHLSLRPDTYIVPVHPPSVIKSTDNTTSFEEYFVTLFTECQNTPTTLMDLTDFILMSPVAPAKITTPPPLPKPECESYPDVFVKNEREDNKVGVLIQVGFDIDIIEILLHEYYDVADYIFIVESTRSHYKKQMKPLLINNILLTERFQKFVDKVVPLILDDSNAIPADADGSIWTGEKNQETYRFRAFFAWNELNKVFGPNDIIGFGDADEIAARSSINTLKRCKWKDSSRGIDVGIWFPRGRLEYAFKTDFPVHESIPYSLGDPTYFKVSYAQSFFENSDPAKAEFLSRKRGESGQYILGGAHLSDHNYLPYRLTKFLTCSECSGLKYEFCQEDMLNSYNKGGMLAIQNFFQDRGRMREPERFERVENLDKLNKKVVVLPWFLDLNRDRFPYFFDKLEPRMRIRIPLRSRSG